MPLCQDSVRYIFRIDVRLRKLLRNVFRKKTLFCVKQIIFKMWLQIKINAKIMQSSWRRHDYIDSFLQCVYLICLNKNHPNQKSVPWWKKVWVNKFITVHTLLHDSYIVFHTYKIIQIPVDMINDRKVFRISSRKNQNSVFQVLSHYNALSTIDFWAIYTQF